MSLKTITIGSVIDESGTPKALVSAEPAFAVVGSVIKLDGRSSSDPLGVDLTYAWSFVSVPIGSLVAMEGFRKVDQDGSVVSFSPDIVGEYVLGLVVSNGAYYSEMTKVATSVRTILVPHAQGIVPDGKFIWSYIRDVWSEVENKEIFETLWSALIQIIGADLLKLYQVDFNKSIRDIQDVYQRRWMSYEPRLELVTDDLSFFLGNHSAGNDATTMQVGTEGQAVILGSDEVVVILGSKLQTVALETLTILYSLGASNVGDYILVGPNLSKNGYKIAPSSGSLDPVPDRLLQNVTFTFPFRSKTWSILSGEGDLALSLSKNPSLIDVLTGVLESGNSFSLNVLVGDVIHYPTGPNAGFYRIVEKADTYVVVDHAPPSYSDDALSATHKANIYRPVGFQVTQPASTTVETISIPLSPGVDLSTLKAGRVIVVGGQAYTIVRVVLDNNQVNPFVVVTVEPDAPAGAASLNWRVPHTLVSKSQNFDDLGVSPGDLMLVDVVHSESQTAVEVVAQVTGVRGNRLGFVLTDEPLVPGEVPLLPAKTLTSIADGFGVTQATETVEGDVLLTGLAKQMFDEAGSLKFQRLYWNTELTPSTEILVSGFRFSLRPRFLIRNTRVPISEDLRSVPMLQEYIAQPSVSEKDGRLFVIGKNGFEKEVSRHPLLLTENIDYIIDGDLAIDHELTFQTGSDVIECDQGDFLDRGIRAGDLFIIDDPITLVGEYVIRSVDSAKQITLSRHVPLYVLSSLVTARVRVQRQKGGSFLRFTPGTFTALSPAPNRIWGEVSFFDNSGAIEDNFGILVGLKKEDLQAVSTDINYRQAVAGMMFAFTKGSAIEKVRLGAQILLGLPFAEHRGVIRSIENDYRLNAAGEPEFGRLLIEDVSKTGTPEGILRVYLFPIDPASALAGIETSPVTGQTYKVGDIVELFAALCKGVEVTDYLTNGLDSSASVGKFLQQYHSINLRANDNIFSVGEISLVSNFLKKITPSYVSFYISTIVELQDEVNIEDKVILKFAYDPLSLVDTIGFGVPPAMMFDSKNFQSVPQALVGEGFYGVRRSGRDLTTVYGSTQATIPSGGVLSPRATEEFEAPLTQVGDYLLILGGPNNGLYEIATVDGDQTFTLAGSPSFESKTDQRYALVRKVAPRLFFGMATVSSPTEFQLSGLDHVSLRTRGVAVGDWFILTDGTDTERQIIVEVVESAPGVWDVVKTAQPSALSGSLDCLIERPSLLTSGETFEFTSSGSNILTATDPLVKGLLSIGDELHVEGLPYTVLDAMNLFVTPVPPAGTFDAVLVRKDRSLTAVSWDQNRLGPLDETETTLVSPNQDAICVGDEEVNMPVNPQVLGVRPGDLFMAVDGSNSTVDVGYGPGVYPIAEVQVAKLFLTVPAPNAETVTWKLIRRAS